MPRVIETPNGALPPSAARDAGPGLLWSVDGSRRVRVDSVAGALELNLYCIRAYAVADAAAVWEADAGLRDLRSLARMDKLQALRTLAVLLPIMADAYEDHDLPTSQSSHQFGKISLDRIKAPDGRVLRSFPTPESWREWGAEIERRYLEPAGISLLGPSDFGTPAAPALVWVVIALVAGAIVASAVAWSIGKVTDYARQELEALESRLACFDRWAAEYAETGSPEARAAMLACHEQAIALSQRGGLAGLLWPLAAVVGIVLVATTID